MASEVAPWPSQVAPETKKPAELSFQPAVIVTLSEREKGFEFSATSPRFTKQLFLSLKTIRPLRSRPLSGRFRTIQGRFTARCLMPTSIA